MLIEKDGITRNIDEKRLAEYKAKGYTPIDMKKAPPKPKQKE